MKTELIVFKRGFVRELFKKNRKLGENYTKDNKILHKNDVKLLTINELESILFAIKMKLAIRFDASAAIDEVLKEGI